MKKLLAILICAAMVMSLATAGFAAMLWDDVGGEEKPDGWEAASGQDKDDNKDDTSDSVLGGDNKDDTSDSVVGGNDDKDDTSDSVVGGNDDKDDTSDSVVGGNDDKDDTSDSVVGGDDNKDDTSDSVVGGDDNKDDTSDSVVGGDDNKDDTSDSVGGDDNKDDTSDTPDTPAVLPTKYIKINGAEFTAEGGKWLYNEPIDTANAAKYQMIIFDKDYKGTFTTNGYGCAIVLNKYGELIEIYAGAYAQYWIAETKAQVTPSGITANDYATKAWEQLEEGETLIIFPNDGGTNTARNWALDLRGLKGTNYFNEIADLEGFTWEVRQPAGGDVVDPNPDAPNAGDSTVVFFALMALSMTAVVVLVSKKRAF